MKRVKSACIKTRAGNRQFVCLNKFAAIAEQNRDKKTRKNRGMVRFDCDGDASALYRGCEEEKGDILDGEWRLVGEHRRMQEGPEFRRILPSSSVESEPLCEMASEYTPMPQPLVFDNGAAETVIPRTWFSEPQRQ